MDRLVEHVVAWHNRHPLAKKITIYDVHTIGVVALPFLRTGRPGTAAGHGGRAGNLGEPIEPVLGDIDAGNTADAGAHDLGESTLDAGVNTTAQHLDALADQEDPPDHLPKTAWWARLGLSAWWPGGGRRAAAGAWPAFSERFIPGLRAARIARFAQAQGFLAAPGDASWPQRVVAMDEALMAKRQGAWPFELFLITAAIDAGTSRSRVLIGVGRKPQMLGPRCWSPLRLGLLAMVVLGLLGLGSALLLQKHQAQQEVVAAAAAEAASAASAASAAVNAAEAAASSAAAAQAASAASAAAAIAAEANSAASAVSAAFAPDSASAGASDSASAALAADAASSPASGTGTGTGTAQASEPQPDIRPQLVKPLPKRTPFGAKPQASEPPAEPDAKAQAKSTSPAGKSLTAPLVEKLGPLGNKAEGKTIQSAVTQEGNKPVVALVGPSSASKQEAEAALVQMRGMIAPMHSGALQAQVFKTPEGWRPAVWPFEGREEAQLINATLVARGMHTKAVDF